MFFTNWTLLVTIVFLAVAIAAQKSESYSLLAIHHLLFEISFVMNIVVVSVYWSTLHHDSLKEAAGSIGRTINCYWAHIVPCLTVSINFAMSDVVIRASHVKALPVIAGLYGY